MITGVSGSGKSTLVKKIIYPALLNYFRDYSHKPGKFNDVSGNLSKIKSVQFIDQNPIGRSSRSNPVTYLKVYDDIRNLFAKIPQSVSKGFKSKFFSFNTDGGRCDECRGEGIIKIEMQFMADVELECDICKGKRFKDEIGIENMGPLAAGIGKIALAWIGLPMALAGSAASGLFSKLAGVGGAIFDGITSFLGGDVEMTPSQLLKYLVMKRIMFSLVAVAALALVSCGSKEAENKEGGPSVCDCVKMGEEAAKEMKDANGDEAKLKEIEIEKAVFPWAASGRAISTNRTEGMTKLIFDKKTNRIIGAGIVGTNAGELIAETVLSIEIYLL